MSFIYRCCIAPHRRCGKDRKLKSLKDHFYRYSETKTKVKTVTIDMYEPYMSLITIIS